MNTAPLEALEAKVEELRKVKVFTEAVKAEAESILEVIPSPDDERTQERKIRVLVLRARAQLVLPRVSMEAEEDLNVALKLGGASAAMWIDLSECLMRRNALREACAALDSALKIDADNVEALCRYSQLLRNRCAEKGLSAEQKAALLDEATARARTAVRADIKSAEAWNTLSLSLLSSATQGGLEALALRKCLAAMQQATTLQRAAAEVKATEEDPDVYFNKAMIEGLLAYYGAAASDYQRAYTLDSQRLRGVERACEENINTLKKIEMRMRNLRGIGKKEMKKILKSLNSGAGATQAGTAGSNGSGRLTLVVVDIVSEATQQPLALLTCNAREEYVVVLLYGVASTTFKIGDRVSFPESKSASETVEHTVLPGPFLERDTPLSLSLMHCYPAWSDVLLNDSAIPSRSRVPIHISSRLFS